MGWESTTFIRISDYQIHFTALPIAATIRIDRGFEVPNKGGGVLDFVDDLRGGMAAQEYGGFFLRLLGLGGQIERHEPVLWEQAP